MRLNILSKVPPVCVGFRESIMETIACFKYGETLEYFFLNASAVARDINQNFQYICGNCRLSRLSMPYISSKDGSLCVLLATTDAERLN